MADLGDKVVDGLAFIVAQAREDLRVYRNTFPAWAAEATERGIMNWSHDRMFAHALRIFDDLTEVAFYDREPRREITVGHRYRLRLKKHEMDGSISTYPTQGALDFLVQEPTLDGLQQVRLIAGPRWLKDEATLGNAVISLRDGKDNLIWMHDLPDPRGGIMTTVPIIPADGPRLPEIGLHGDEATGEGLQEDL